MKRQWVTDVERGVGGQLIKYSKRTLAWNLPQVIKPRRQKKRQKKDIAQVSIRHVSDLIRGLGSFDLIHRKPRLSSRCMVVTLLPQRQLRPIPPLEQDIVLVNPSMSGSVRCREALAAQQGTALAILTLHYVTVDHLGSCYSQINLLFEIPRSRCFI
jgi:hypothetical protein